MASETSFFYAIFRKLQAAAGIIYAYGQEHFSAEADNDVAGGFSLRAPNDPNGIMGALSPMATMYGYTPGWQPLNPNSLVPDENPLYVMLKASLGPTPLPDTVTVNGQVWPVMPMPDINQSIGIYDDWKQFNQSVPTVMEAFADWITKGKLDDTPKANALKYTTLQASPPKAFGFAKGSDHFPVLFVASFTGDDGRRPGDAGVPGATISKTRSWSWLASMTVALAPLERWLAWVRFRSPVRPAVS